ncbi:MAG: cytochrome c oxidase assembly protein [Burkholderiales bacterium]
MNLQQANRQMLVKLAVLALAMFGFGFALVPFYQKICEVAGINNLVKPAAVVKNTQIDSGRWITVEFDANTHGMPWEFFPLQRSVRVHPGEMIEVAYSVRNTGSSSVVGQAIPSYGPKAAAEHVRKLECFCFTQQALAPGESRQMPVQLVIDPALPQDVNTVTLSYTFFEVQGGDVRAGKGKAG